MKGMQTIHGKNVLVKNDELTIWVDRSTGLKVIDISNPSSPFIAGSYNPAGQARDVVTSGEYVYLVDDETFYTLSTEEVGTSLNGDVNLDFEINSLDIIYLVNFTFRSGPPPQPGLLAGDTNCNGYVTVSDIIFLVAYVFLSGPEPACP